MPFPSASEALVPLRNLRHQVYSNPGRKRASIVVSPTSDPFSSSFSSSTTTTTAASSSSSSPSSRPAPDAVESASSLVPCPAAHALPSDSSSTAVSGPSSHPPHRPSLPLMSSSAASAGVSKRSSPSSSRAAAVRRTPSEGFVAEVKRRREEKTKMKLAVGSVGSAGPQEYRILFEDEYRDDVLLHMRHMEKLTKSHVDLMDLQPELRWFMRPYLVEFLVEIHQQFRLRPEVLYLTVNIVDRYVSKRIVFKKHYQLVGCAALWIAAKFEDAKDKVPSVEALRDMCCAAYDESAFLQMEGHVLSTISWTLGHPTAEAWLRLSCMGTSKEDAETQHVARFVMELTLFHKEFAAYLPSAIAAGSLLLARFLLRKSLRHCEDHGTAIQIALALDAHLGERLEQVSEIVIAKYSHSYYNRASTFVREEYLKGRRFEIRLVSASSAGGIFTPPSSDVSPVSTTSSSSSSSANIAAVAATPARLIPPRMPPLVPSRSYSTLSSTASSVLSSPRNSISAYSSDSDMPDTPTFATLDPFVVTIAGSSSSGSISSVAGVAPAAPTSAQFAAVAQASQKKHHQHQDIHMHSAPQLPAGHYSFVVQEPRVVFSSLSNSRAVSSDHHKHQQLPSLQHQQHQHQPQPQHQHQPQPQHQHQHRHQHQHQQHQPTQQQVASAPNMHRRFSG